MSSHRSPLHDEHARLGARMAESEGWSMPLEFAGVFKEYQAHWKASVVWDASNLGSIRVSGPGARDLLQRTFTNDLRRCGPGRSQYTFLLSGADASVVDDLMVWWVETDLFLLTPNRPEAVLSALRSVQADGPRADCVIEDVSADRVLLALQGAQAAERMAELAPAAGSMPASGVRRLDFHGSTALVATTRFGRQSGFELQLAPPAARTVYRSLVARGVAPAGLGMRETHRLEVGIARHGFELGPAITPLEVGCERAVGFDTDFVGRSALITRRRRGIRQILRAIVMTGRQIPQHGGDVFLDDEKVGRVTSGNFSPRLHCGLALAFVRPEVAPGSTVTVSTVRGEADGTVAATPVDPGQAVGART
ncbi:glycine cleavage T C-terminal barrel domain-containing protein [Actinacidiphila oryziradicis]|uniref:Glycine cleavage system protein T n=1 Tax=Actinacidiphila oryziradicis TaxID=2571141 RepID=A0A4U0RVL8_9ACTN|nr:glycine cleavage T C-terminal barrel domain-containing protein [Actinacidiphila oryziradicis]TKA00302.1 glycine cleavage system protein T [Actinacidiphila oryziradicis]